MNYSELLQLAKGWGNFKFYRGIIWRLLCFPEEGDLLARLNQYIKICSELLNIKLFVFIGMRNYFTGDEISMLAMEAGYLGCSILCIENMCSGAEKDMILIDKDLCRVV